MNKQYILSEEDMERVIRAHFEAKGEQLEGVLVEVVKEWRGYGLQEHQVDVAQATVYCKCEEGADE